VGIGRLTGARKIRGVLHDRKFVSGIILLFVLTSFLWPVFSVRLSPNIWYPYVKNPRGLGSLTYAYFGYGAVGWYPNHYWIYLGPSVLQLMNSSPSSITVQSIDQKQLPIFGYYVIFSDSNGKQINSGYTPVTFSATAGTRYVVEVQGYGSCKFNHWSAGTNSSEVGVLARSGGQTMVSVFDC
jgi:hypothetical protein